LSILLALLGVSVFAGCSGPAKIRQFSLGYPVGYEERGMASWYGPGFHGNRTASGELFDMHQLTAAHRTLPMGSLVLVRSLRTGQQVTVRINDRGPFTRGRVIDVSQTAARALGMIGNGTDEVALRVTGYQGRPEAFGFLRIQVASFVEQENAQALASRLKRRYSDVRIVSVDLPLGRRYRVLVGRFSSEGQASAVAQELDAQFNVESIVIRDDV
jgi:rare lipoprotein A